MIFRPGRPPSSTGSFSIVVPPLGENVAYSFRKSLAQFPHRVVAHRLSRRLQATETASDLGNTRSCLDRWLLASSLLALCSLHQHCGLVHNNIPSLTSWRPENQCAIKPSNIHHDHSVRSRMVRSGSSSHLSSSSCAFPSSFSSFRSSLFSSCTVHILLPYFNTNMYPITPLPALALFFAATVAASCNRDNCFRALIAYERTADSTFCNNYLATS